MQRAKWIGKTIAVLAAACVLGAAGDARSSLAGNARGEQAQGNMAPPRTLPQIMTKRVGEYTRTIQFVTADGPQGEPSTGTSKISTILEGRFLMEENNDVAMGRPVSGMRLYGYNSGTQQYEAAWMYTLSTAILMLTGTSSDGGKTVDYTGTSTTSNGDKLKLHARFRQVDDDQFVITLFSTGADGKETPFQETTYKRKK